jgi:hypothetical protein
MKLLSIANARSIWLGQMNDFNPRGVDLIRIAIPILVQNYKFTKFPTNENLPDGKQINMKFEMGSFQPDPNKLPIHIALTIYSDGFVAETGSSTFDSDLFLADMLNRISDAAGLPSYKEIIQKYIYLSQVYVTTDKNLEMINPKFKQISKYLSNNVEEDKYFEVGGLSFWPDQTSKVNPSPFTLERALNSPFFEKRYFSTAPLPTDKHLELLNKLEEIMSK